MEKKIGILSIAITVIMLGFGMVIPIFPFYIERMGATAKDLGFLLAIYSLMQLFLSPVWGSLSDKYGRKPILIVGLIGNGLTAILFGLSTELWMLFVARSLSGLLSSATLPSAMAYISDSTTDKERGGGMGILWAASGLGMILGPAFGGWLGSDSLSLPFFIAGFMSFVSVLLVIIFLPESLNIEIRKSNKSVRTIELKEIWTSLSTPIGILLLMSFLVSFGLSSFEGIYGLYALEKFGYGTKMVGTIFMTIGIVSTVTQGILTGPLTKKYGELSIVKISLVLSSISFILLTIAYNFPLILLTTGFFILSNALLRPTVASIISKTKYMANGKVMGLNNSYMSLGRVIGPIWAGTLFDINFELPYISGSLIMLIGFLVIVCFLSKSKINS